jgi:hypothetical protein
MRWKFLSESYKSMKQREKRRLRNLIKEYSEMGYEAYAELKGYPSPEVIEGNSPDLILKKGNKIIIIEIASTQDLKRLSDKIQVLAKYADKRENVRFDVVLSNPNPRLSEKEKIKSKEILLDDIQTRLYREANQSYSEGFYRGSFLCLTVLLENLLQQKAIEKKAISISDKITMNKLLYVLRTNRIISDSNFKTINNFVKIRNKVVHQGFEPTKETTDELFKFVSFFNKHKRTKEYTVDGILIKLDENNFS